jgi:hypothetical protein
VSSGVAAVLREEGGLLADELTGADPEGDFAVAAIREGWRLHSEGRGEVLAPDEPDLALLGGDRLYALGLERLAAEGDLEAVAALADVISQCARSHAEGEPAIAQEAWRRLTLRDG